MAPLFPRESIATSTTYHLIPYPEGVHGLQQIPTALDCLIYTPHFGLEIRFVGYFFFLEPPDMHGTLMIRHAYDTGAVYLATPPAPV